MSKSIGLISHQTDDGLLHVFVLGGKHSDLTIDQRSTTNGEQRFCVGDFVLFVDSDGPILSPSRTEPLFETRIQNNHLQVKIPVAFPPPRFNERPEFIAAMLAWSPEFAYVGCFHALTPKPRRNWMYMAWVQRVPQMMQSIANISIAWQIVTDVLDDCNEKSRQQLNNAFNDNYEGLVTSVNESSARVWSLAIPVSEVVFLFGAREGMQVGDWVQFNCEASVRPHLNCYLFGKKFTIIEPILPAKAHNNTVMVEIITDITNDAIQEYPTGEVTIKTATLGLIEFRPGRFRPNFCGKRMRMAVYKDIPSSRTGAVWRFYDVEDKRSSPISETIPDQQKQLPSAEIPSMQNIRHGIQDEVIPLRGVITKCGRNRIYIWTKNGDVLWETRDLSEKFLPGTWLSFSAVPLVPPFRSCMYTVHGNPEIIPPVLETRVVDGFTEIKTKIECDRSAHSDIQSAYSEELGRIFIPDSTTISGLNAYVGHTGDFLGSFMVWVRRKFGGLYQWEIVEVTERYVECRRHSVPCGGLHSASEDSAAVYVPEQRDAQAEGNRLQRRETGSSLPGTSQKETDYDVYSGFFNDDMFGNRRVRKVKSEEEFDPLGKPVFGATEPRPPSSDPSALNGSNVPQNPENGSEQGQELLAGMLHYYGTGGFPVSGYPKQCTEGHPFVQHEEIPEEELQQSGNRFQAYLMQVWKIPGVRRAIARADVVLYANIMQSMTDLNARVEGDSLEEVLKPSNRPVGNK